MPTLSPLSEGSKTLTAASEGSVPLTALAEFQPVAAIPGLYPSAATYPSAAGTYPSIGTPPTGLFLTPLPEA